MNVSGMLRSSGVYVIGARRLWCLCLLSFAYASLLLVLFSSFNVCDRFEDRIDLGRDNGISETLKAVHPSGNPIIHSAKAGCNFNP